MNLVRSIPRGNNLEEQDRLIPQCPRCLCNLQGKKHPTGIAWQCAKCGGESLNFSQFRRLIPELHANEIWMTAMEQPAAPRRRARCPECRKDMAAVLIPFQGREIELDICRICQRLWMESQEDQAVKLDISETPPGKKPPVIRMTGRGVERMVKEQAKRIHGHWREEGQLLIWKIGIILLLILWRFWVRK